MKRTLSLLLAFLFVFLGAEPMLAVAAENIRTGSLSADYIPGDVNNDGAVKAVDARSILRYSVALETEESLRKNCKAPDSYNVMAAADVNNDTKITAADARLTLRISVGLEKAEPVRSFKVSFDTNGGTVIEDMKVAKGTVISDLPEPFYAGYTFDGWFYDEKLTLKAGELDEITKDITLYAAYKEAYAAVIDEASVFTGAANVSSDFSINVISSDNTLNASSVEALLSVKNLSAPEDTDIISVSGGNGKYTISGKNGFAEGATYRITLEDDRLTFEGCEKSVRDYNFYIEMDEVKNVTYSDDVIYIPAEEVSDIIKNGEKTESLTVPILSFASDGSTKDSSVEGSFEYDGKEELKNGSVVVVYEGVRPDKRVAGSSYENYGEVAYLKVTQTEGDVVSFENAEADEVLFFPDILPVNVRNDKDSDGNIVKLENSVLDFSDDIYENIGLDSETKVEAGDYIALYSGEFGAADSEIIEYALIKSISAGETETVLKTERCSLEDIYAAMDFRVNQPVDGDELLENADIAALEESIEKQAIESGFAEEVALFMSSFVTATDNVTELPDNMEINDISVTLADGTEVSPGEIQLVDSGARVSVSKPECKPVISTTLKHFDGVSGVRLTLTVTCKITFSDSKGKKLFDINITGKTENEISISIDTSAEAIWKVWFIFPYIADYRASVGLNMYKFTGLGIEAMMQSGEYEKESDDKDEDKNKDEDIAELEQEIDEISTMLKEIKDLMKKKDGGGNKDTMNIADDIVDKYASLAEKETEMITLMRETIVQQTILIVPVCPIISINLKLDFVLSFGVNASIGMEYYHKEATRYVFTVHVIAAKVTSDVISLEEESQNFSFFAIGKLKIRAGICGSISIALITDALASVEFSIEGGLYLDIYGYFYYERTKKGDGAWETDSCGNLYIEAGTYLVLSVSAQVLKNLAAAEDDFVDKSWPFWHMGEKKSVIDFALSEEETENISMKKHHKSVVLSDDIFTMKYIDMISGKFSEQAYDEEYFDITISDDAFSYDAATNTLTVSPGADDECLDAEMTIVWKSTIAGFSSRAKRTFALHWDNYKDGYMIIPHSNEGSFVDIISSAPGEAIRKPASPVRKGYVFAGWFSDPDCKVPYAFPDKMPAVDTEIYAAWTPATDTPYKVEHYLQKVGSTQYELFETEDYKGITDSKVNVPVKLYKGFVSPEASELQILADGSAVCRYYYERKLSTVTFDPGEVPGEKSVYKLHYGAYVYEPQFFAEGYDFVGWDKEVNHIMGEESVTYTALWEKSASDYRVEYYVQQPDGKYKLTEKVFCSDITGTEITQAKLLDEVLFEDGKTATEKLIEPGKTEFECVTFCGENVTQSGKSIIVQPDCVIKVRIKRLSHKTEFRFNNGQDSVVYELLSGAPLTAPSGFVKAGYAFTGWDKPVPAYSGAEDLVFEAQWKPNDYSVAFDSNGGRGSMASQGMIYDKSAALNPNIFSRDGYSFEGWALAADGEVAFKDKAEIINLAASGTKTLYAVWKTEEYSISYTNAREHGNPLKYTVESEKIVLLPPAAEKGYTFEGWADEKGNIIKEIPKGSFGNIILKAVWTRNATEIVFVSNSKNNETARQTYLYGESGALRENTFTLEGYSFAGWSLSASDTEAVYKDRETVSFAPAGKTETVYLYAVWTPVEYSVVYEANGGVNSNNPAKYTIEDSFVLTAPVKTGYEFTGWYKNEALTDGPVNRISAGSTGNMKLYASWTPKNDTVYTVKHYLEAVDGSYVLDKAEAFTGVTDSTVEASVRSYAGFASPEAKSVVINGDGSSVVEYSYTRNIHTVTYRFNDNATEDKVTQGRFGSNIEIIVPVRAGYAFDGWFDNSSFTGEPLTAGTIPDEDIILYAKWTAGKYNYTAEHYTENPDGTWKKETVTSGTAETDSFVTPEVMSFEGFTSPEAQTVKIGVVNEPVKYYYKRNAYKLSWNFNGGTAQGEYTDKTTVLFGESIKAPVVTKYGYSGQWDNSPAQTMPAGDVSYSVIWTPETYTVYFNALGGVSEKDSMNAVFGNSLGTLPECTRDYYSFDGWFYEDGTAVTEDTVLSAASDQMLYAHWTPVVYNISYKNLDGNNSIVTGSDINGNPGKYTTEDTFALNQPVMEGYDFVGWIFGDSQIPVKDAVITGGAGGELEFTAVWQIHKHTITAYLYPGKAPVVVNIDYGAPVSAFVLEEVRGYTFSHYDTLLPETMPDKDIIVRAVWTADVYTISYSGEANDTVENPASYTVEDSIVFNNPERTGYTFEGWLKNDASGERITGIEKGSIGNISLYASWSANSYTVRYNSNYGENICLTDDFTYGVAGKLSSDVFTRTGYSFVGWATASTGEAVYENGEEIADLSPVNGDVIDLYAVWQAIEYPISYAGIDEADNSSENPVSYSVENNRITLEAPVSVPEGMYFAGWFEDELYTKSVETGKTFTIDNVGGKTFYCKLEKVIYRVIIDNNIYNDNLHDYTYEYYYGDSIVLPSLAEELSENREGYSLEGWSLIQDGEVDYKGTTEFSEVFITPEMTAVVLYAVWSEIPYKINYSEGAGFDKGLPLIKPGNPNPKKYTVATEEIILEAPLAKDGYEFIGWTDENGNTVTSIKKGSTGDISLTGNWAHPGIFMTEIIEDETVDIKHKVAFYSVTIQKYLLTKLRINRVQPEGTVASENPIQVYYRTNSRTAIGSYEPMVELEMVVLSGKVMADGKNFLHIDGYVTFNKDDTYKTVTGPTELLTDSSRHSVYYYGADRYYSIQIYDVVDSVSGKTFDSSGSELKRTVKSPLNVSDLFNEEYYYEFVPVGEEYTVWENNRDSNTSYSVKFDDYSNVSSSDLSYAKYAGAQCLTQIRIDMKEKNHGYQHIYVSNQDGEYATWYIELGSGYKHDYWKTDVLFPFVEKQGEAVLSTDSAYPKFRSSENMIVETDGEHYISFSPSDTMKLQFGSGGSMYNRWIYGQTDSVMRFYDTQAPYVKGVASLAETHYDEGDTIYISVIFNEIVSDVKKSALYDVSLANLPEELGNFRYCDGTGTNVLTFECEVLKDFEGNQLNSKLADCIPVISNLKCYDISGNTAG